MNEHSLRRTLEGGGGIPGTLFRAGLWFPGKIYGSLMELRRTAYKCGLLDSTHAEAPTISVGNLTAGGSGKTPFTIMLAKELALMGRKPAILIRGYRQSASGLSDEAILYRRHCPDCLVEIGSDRRAGAARAIAAGADVLLMDDGFQHLKLRRDLDIVLVDATAPWGGGNTIPGGLLREPRNALRDARVIVVTRSDQRPKVEIDRLREQIAGIAPAAMVFSARHRPCALWRLDDSEIPLTELQGRRVVALSGIARPEAFENTLVQLGSVLVGSFAGRDHDHFGPEFLKRALTFAKSENALIIITEKDRSKEIFAELADNSDKDIIDAIGILEIEQEVDDKMYLLSLLREVLHQKH